MTISEQEYVENGLKSLGNTVEEVRETLSQMGLLNMYRPMRSRTRECPIAQFVKAHVGQERNVSTLMSNTLVDMATPTEFHVFHPRPVIDFIGWFDRGVRN